MNNTEELISKLENGATLEQGLRHLRNLNVSPVESIKAIKNVKNISLGDAKNVFSKSPSWSKEVLAANELHQEIIDEIDVGSEKI